MVANDLLLSFRNFLLLFMMALTAQALSTGTVTLPRIFLNLWVRYRAGKLLKKSRKAEPKPEQYREIDMTKFE